MDGVTTLGLHQAADRAAEEGDFWTALRCAADALAATPSDHRARAKVALSLAALGRDRDAVRTLEVGARDLIHRGFVLSALGMARDALSFAPDDEGVWDCVEAAHRVSVPGERPRVPPPIPPAAPVDERAFQAIDDRAALLDRAAELGASEPASEAGSPPFALPLFGDMSLEAFRSTMTEIELRKLRSGTEVVRQGEPGDALFIVVRGEVEVLRDGAPLAVLGAGSFFGELSLFLHKPRSATVRARQATELFVLTREQVERLARQHEGLSEDLAAFARRRLLANVLATSPIFAPFKADQKRAFLAGFETALVPEGQAIIREGEVSPGLFVVVEGEVQVTKTDAQSDPVVVAHLGPGEVFGEIGLVRDELASANVVTTESCMLLQLPRDGFADLLRDLPEAQAYLEGLSETRLAELRDAFGSSEQIMDADDLVVV